MSMCVRMLFKTKCEIHVRPSRNYFVYCTFSVSNKNKMVMKIILFYDKPLVFSISQMTFLNCKNRAKF